MGRDGILDGFFPLEDPCPCPQSYRPTIDREGRDCDVGRASHILYILRDVGMRPRSGQRTRPGHAFFCRDSVKCGIRTVLSGLMEFYARLSRMPASQYGSSFEIKVECTPGGSERGQLNRSVWDGPRERRQAYTFILVGNNSGIVGKERERRAEIHLE